MKLQGLWPVERHGLFGLLNSESKRNTALEAIMLFGSGSANEIPTT
jgi:hypothetical protein